MSGRTVTASRLVPADPATVFAFLAQTWAVQNSSASRASLLLGTEPVWAVAVGIETSAPVFGFWVPVLGRSATTEDRHRALAHGHAAVIG